LGNQIQNLDGELFQRRNAPTAPACTRKSPAGRWVPVPAQSSV
jgi:hypothetical protein